MWGGGGEGTKDKTSRSIEKSADRNPWMYIDFLSSLAPKRKKKTRPDLEVLADHSPRYVRDRLQLTPDIDLSTRKSGEGNHYTIIKKHATEPIFLGQNKQTND